MNVTSYRNSKNFGSSWISAANATWYLREARFLNNARNICKTSCAVSGSGYLISSSVIEGMHGWQFHTLTEDIQFTTFCAIHGIRIGYAPAEFFDEQPVTVKGIIHLGNVIAGDNVIGIEDKVALKRVGILVENAVEAKVHDPALALAGQVIALVNNGTGLARELRRVVGAGIGDHENLDELGRIILVLDGANEVGDHGA